MQKKFFVLLLSVAVIYGVEIPQGNFVGTAVVPGDENYYMHTQDNIEIIYTQENAKEASHVSKLEPSIHKNYENFYDWVLDERLSVGLISNNNQIANGFSTQYPNNRQINYVGGTAYIDYFTTTSWLDTLLYHETAHNYQLNTKGSKVSQGLHSFMGNGSIVFPFFIVPNIMENSFMLEGNAVLNESWHGNGGRLYSGRFYAQTVLQAKAGKIESSEVYNSKIEFPYGEIYYIQGGFYNYYMAQNHGLKNINNYFKRYSRYWFWPFLTNRSMRIATGDSFEESLNSFAVEYSKVPLVKAQGELLASSQFFYSLNNDAKEIYFLTNESGRRAPELVVIDKKDASITKKRGSWSSAKVIKVNEKYFTQSSANISPTKIIQGLYDEDKFLLKDTHSKMVQGYLSDNRMVYFDVASSYEQAQLYVGKEFYGQVNSSVYIDVKDNLYYFKQNGKTRTLYKNKRPLFSLKSFYAIVSDVDTQGNIYFISNSKNGSSLYKYINKKITRVSSADNIVEARLINDDEVLLAAIGEEEYYYIKTHLENIKEVPFEVKLFFEQEPYYASIRELEKSKEILPDISQNYNSLLDMRYSGTDFFLLGSSSGVTGTLNLKFADPLTQNAMNAFISRDELNVTIAGAGYESALFRLNYGVSFYGVLENSQRDSLGNAVPLRDNGLIAYAEYPLYKAGYLSSSFKASYYQDYDTLSREPLSIELDFYRAEQYGVSMLANYLHYLNVYASNDRGDTLYGSSYAYTHDLPWEFYLSLSAKYSAVSTNLDATSASATQRGVKIARASYASEYDPSVISMKSIEKTIYTQDAGYVDVGLSKVLNLSAYFFTFPFSLQRELVYANYRHYFINDMKDESYRVTEVKAGVSLSTVFLNKFSFPIGLEYIYNDTFFAKATNQLFFTLGTAF